MLILHVLFYLFYSILYILYCCCQKYSSVNASVRERMREPKQQQIVVVSPVLLVRYVIDKLDFVKNVVSYLRRR